MELDQAFVDWEGAVFGFGYGSGEQYVLPALRLFMQAIPVQGNYDYAEIEKQAGKEICWLFINALCHADIIEYGSSPRFGWLTESGKALQAYILSKTAQELYQIVTEGEQSCSNRFCNCGDSPTDGKCLNNPFFS